jgi:hypothetical protein
MLRVALLRLQIFCPCILEQSLGLLKTKMPQYDDGASMFESVCDLEIFQYSGRCISPKGTREISREEYKVAFLYILTYRRWMISLSTFFKSQSLIYFNSVMICAYNSNSINVENLTRSNGRVVLFQLNNRNVT